LKLMARTASPEDPRPTRTAASLRDRLTITRDRITRDRVLLALLALLGVGLLRRVWLTLVWTPAFVGYSDTGVYFQDSVASLWTDPIRTVGYSMFLRALHWISPHLLFVTIVQHGLGLATALLLFFAVRGCGGPRWLGLAPAAMIALGGDQLYLEHSALSDSLFIFLIAATLYSALRASHASVRAAEPPPAGRGWLRARWRGMRRAGGWWAVLAGLCAGLCVWDRTAGVVIVPLIAIWLLFSAGRPTRRTLTVGTLSLVVSLASIGGYVEWRQQASGLSGLTSNDAWNLYGRVAPWADCTKFTPPAGTRGLCQTTPVSQRAVHEAGDYIYDVNSPAQLLFGVPYKISTYPNAMGLMTKWSEAAILGQPFDYLHAVWLDTLRLFDPSRYSYGLDSADQLVSYLLYGINGKGENEFVTSWQVLLYPHDPPAHHGEVGPFKEWERITRVDGVWMGILLFLCLAGPWVLAGRARAGMLLFALAALGLLFFPMFTNGYDYRYTIAAFGPLVAAGALAGWGLAVRLRSLVGRIRRKPDPARA
jgi:hypothetical protein